MRNENLNHCRICFSNKLTGYLDLGKQPFSNSFLNYNDLKNEKKFPLKTVLCKICGLSQLSIIPNTKFIFSKYDYLSSPNTNPEKANLINYIANNRHLPNIQYPLTTIYSTKNLCYNSNNLN